MTYDRDKFFEFQKERRADRVAGNAQALQLLAQAAVPAASLMSDPNWSVYQQMLQAALERIAAQRARLADTLASAQCSTFEQMARIKHLMAECDGMLAAWHTAIDLPKQILANADQAQKALDEKLQKYDDEANRKTA